MSRLNRVIVALMLGALAAGGAEAAPLGPSSLFGNIHLVGAGADVTVTELGTFSLAAAGIGAVSLSDVGSPFPSLTAELTIGPDGALGQAAVSFQYQIEVLGPVGQLVPVTMSAIGEFSGEATAQASFGALVQAGLFVGPGVILSKGGSFVGPGTFSDGFDDAANVMLFTNTPYTAVMFASVGGNITAAGAKVHARAYVDPIFTLGSGVDPLLYSFAFSPGIGNSRPTDPDPDPDPDPTVPEPTALALLAVGALSAAARGTRGVRR
jgi:hypothetical protein